MTIQDQQSVTTVTSATEPATAYPPAAAVPVATTASPAMAYPPVTAVPVATTASPAMAYPPVTAVPVAAAASPVTAVPVAAAAPTALEPTVATNRTVIRRESYGRASDGETVRRVIVLVFGIAQLLIGARIVLLLLAARHSNGLVAGILNISQPLVTPFEGILRTNSLSTSGSVLDVAGLLAVVGWAIVELIVIWILAIFRRQSALGQA